MKPIALPPAGCRWLEDWEIDSQHNIALSEIKLLGDSKSGGWSGSSHHYAYFTTLSPWSLRAKRVARGIPWYPIHLIMGHDLPAFDRALHALGGGQ